MSFYHYFYTVLYYVHPTRRGTSADYIEGISSFVPIFRPIYIPLYHLRSSWTISNPKISFPKVIPTPNPRC